MWSSQQWTFLLVPLINCVFALKGKNVHTEHETSVQPPIFATVSDTVWMFSANVFLDFSVCIAGANLNTQTAH